MVVEVLPRPQHHWRQTRQWAGRQAEIEEYRHYECACLKLDVVTRLEDVPTARGRATLLEKLLIAEEVTRAG